MPHPPVLALVLSLLDVPLGLVDCVVTSLVLKLRKRHTHPTASMTTAGIWSMIYDSTRQIHGAYFLPLGAIPGAGTWPYPPGGGGGGAGGAGGGVPPAGGTPGVSPEVGLLSDMADPSLWWPPPPKGANLLHHLSHPLTDPKDEHDGSSQLPPPIGKRLAGVFG
jgi:hypothetical protein